MTTLLRIILLTLVIGMVVPSTAGAVEKAAKLEVKPQTICPIMGGKINKKLYVDHAGKRIYVCCPGCLGKVKKDPAKIIKQLEAQGITLDKVPTKGKPGVKNSQQGSA